MFGIDQWIAQLGGGSVVLALLVALLLGLRHATDPDHLTTIATLALDDEQNGSRRAGWLGAAWGLGHATTLLAFGMPAVLLGHALPSSVEQWLEFLIGVMIVGLAVRLLVRWWRGYMHAHEHTHGEKRHVHPHVHEGARAAHPAAHDHSHDNRIRSTRTAFGIGLVHGAAGSAGAGVLLVSTISSRTSSAVALVFFALATAASMALISAGFGQGFARGISSGRLRTLTPAFGVAGALFGTWYALAAFGALPYIA
jgi:ABC-type nickel/cobalt efflux system permease component RcnA